jgi:DNA modification methylase
MTPYLSQPGITVYHGDALAVLRELPADSVQCVCTSPPYFGQRDYGVDGQIGLEQTPAGYVARIVEVFAEVRRVLRPDGTLWLNLGDSYCNAGSRNNGTGLDGNRRGGMLNTNGTWADAKASHGDIRHRLKGEGIKHKDLIGVPWAVAFALREDGWYLRSAAPWVKRNAMPESVTDRPASAVEYWFMLTRSARYYFDAGAVKVDTGNVRSGSYFGSKSQEGTLRKDVGRPCRTEWDGRSRRNSDWWFESVLMNDDGTPLGWDVPTAAFDGAHFSTFPPQLIRPQILCGSRLGDVVLDPFHGSGTTGAVSHALGRRYVGTELNRDYIELSRGRYAQAYLWTAALA